MTKLDVSKMTNIELISYYKEVMKTISRGKILEKENLSLIEDILIEAETRNILRELKNEAD